MNAVWRVERTTNRQFPFRISIDQFGRTILAVRAKAMWPGPGQNIFCLREREFDPAESLELIERVPVLSVTHVGRKLALVLDRPQRKRCEFLTVEKERADGTGMYEQVFFRTESGIRAHRSRTRVELRNAPDALDIAIDSAEKYPWTFPGASTRRRKLPVGDYALMVADQIHAIVERKSYDNLLGDVGALQALHHQLADLASYPVSALVIEAEYRDFMNASRLKGRWPAAHLTRVLGELAAMHPKLPIIYAGNRKAANTWTHQFFLSIAARREAPSPQLVLETVARYDAMPRGAGIDEQIRQVVLNEMPDPFAITDLSMRFPDAGLARVQRIVQGLRDEGRLTRVGRGRGAKWARGSVSQDGNL